MFEIMGDPAAAHLTALTAIGNNCVPLRVAAWYFWMKQVFSRDFANFY